MPQVVYTTLTICVVGPIGASLYFIYGAFHQEISGTLSQLAHLRSNSIGPYWPVKFQAALEFSFCLMLRLFHLFMSLYFSNRFSSVLSAKKRGQQPWNGWNQWNHRLNRFLRWLAPMSRLEQTAKALHSSRMLAGMCFGQDENARMQHRMAPAWFSLAFHHNFSCSNLTDVSVDLLTETVCMNIMNRV